MTNHFAATPTTTLLTGQGRAPAGLARVVEDVDDRCSVIDHRDPRGGRRWWIEAPNLGSPFDDRLRHEIRTRAAAAGIRGF